MKLIHIDRNPPVQQLRVFGLIWLVFFGVIGGILLKKGGSLPVSSAIWVMAVLVPAIGWIFPRFMRIVYLGLAYATFPIGYVVSFTIMVVVYYLILTPIGLFMRMIGHDPMEQKFDTDAKSYWIPREQDDRLETYFRQF